jgi:hypothetical protein
VAVDSWAVVVALVAEAVDSAAVAVVAAATKRPANVCLPSALHASISSSRHCLLSSFVYLC